MLPICTYIYSTAGLDEVQPVKNMLNKRVGFYVKPAKEFVRAHNRFVPIAGSCGPEMFVLAKTGDFCVTSVSHLFVSTGFSSTSIGQDGISVITSSLPDKYIVSSLWGRSLTLSELLALIARGDTISLHDRRIRKLAFKLAVKRSCFQLSFRKAHLLRSVLDAFGYNLICCKVFPAEEEGIFSVRWSRKHFVRIQTTYPIRRTGDIRIRFISENIRGSYTAVGFIHRSESLSTTI